LKKSAQKTSIHCGSWHQRDQPHQEQKFFASFFKKEALSSSPDYLPRPLALQRKPDKCSPCPDSPPG
jgi:hypothetical protein